MSLLVRTIHEPLLQFFLIGAAVFGLYALTADNSQEDLRGTIVVTEGRIQQLAEVFTKTWQRPPTDRELHGLIDAYVKEEVYYREALKLALDRDDTLIRRRMQQKMEFLTEPDEDLLVANDSGLQAFLDANKDQFRVEPRVAFEQVFINPKKGNEPASARAKQTLAALEASASGSMPSNLGDSTLLPAITPLSPLSSIARNFGETFAQKLTDLPEDDWAGPVESAFGLHLVRVTERINGYDPPLQEVRKSVEQKWRTQKRDDFQKQEYDRLRAKYDVVVTLSDDRAPEQKEPAR
jgi:hypothetical protein